MHKQRNDERQSLPNRLRACLLASVAAIAVAAAPVPAHAFLGGITKAIGGLFGGGGAGGGGSGCLGGEGGFFDSILDVGSGLAKAAGGSLGSIGSVGSDLVQGENKVLGCPVMESIPGAMEIQTIKAAVEAVLQTKEMIEQTAHQADMLAHSRFSLIDWLMDNWETFLSLLGGESEAITWEQPDVQGEFEEAYPEEPVFTTEEDLKTLRERQAVIGREASIDSKRISAQLAQDVEALSAQLDSLEMERRNCPGQTCVADVNVQLSMVSAQLSAKVALMQAAHNRVAESQIDAEREAKKAADAEWKRVMEGVDTYSGGN